MNRKVFLKKYFLSLMILFMISLLIFGLVFKFELTLKNVSDSIFIVNIITFVIALIFQTGATRSLMSMNYTLKTWFKRKDTKEKYESFQDYYNQHQKSHVKDMLHIIGASITFIIIAAIIGAI